MTARGALRRIPRQRAAELYGGWWALRAVWRVRRALRERPLAQVNVAGPARRPREAGRGVERVLRLLDPSCLERSLVLQRWLATQGHRRAVVIGVRGRAAGFGAHAWLDGEAAPGFEELTRLGP